MPRSPCSRALPATRPETELRLRARDGSYRWFVFSTTYSQPDGLVFLCGKDVTARKQGEEELRAAEERFRALTGSTRDGIVSADVSGDIIFWNAGAEAIFGRSAADALGRPLTDLMPERHREWHTAGIARFLATGKSRLMGATTELEGLRADGSEFPLEISLGSWIQNDQRCFTGVLRDVSESVHARRALREAEARFAGAFEGAAVGLLLAAPDGTLLLANRALCKLSGRPEEELVGRSYDELLHPDEHNADDAGRRAMLAGQHPAARERAALPRGRRLGHGRAHQPLADPQHRRRAAAFRRPGRGRDGATPDDRGADPLPGPLQGADRAPARLHPAPVRSRPAPAPVRGRPDALARLRAAGARGQAAGRGAPPEAFDRLAPAYRAALAGETRSFDLDSSDGRATYWVQMGPLRDDGGHVIGGMAISRDISARRHAERKLQEHALELERSNAELEQFAYVASHDLSEPLRMISSYLQLLRRRYHGELDSDADEFIDFAVDGAARMRDLIDGLLTFSRAGRGDQPFEPVDLQALAERAAADAVAAPAGAEPRIAVGPLPTVHGDAHGLGQLFQNLIGNAVKFVPADRVAEVGIDAEREGDLWRFTVTDNGIGLEPAYAERIFRMFQRLHTRDDYPGTGIGLAIARKVVERHGGTIWAEPRADVGSRFSFTLPAATDEP